jgi:hypothetical protein
LSAGTALIVFGCASAPPFQPTNLELLDRGSAKKMFVRTIYDYSRTGTYNIGSMGGTIASKEISKIDLNTYYGSKRTRDGDMRAFLFKTGKDKYEGFVVTRGKEVRFSHDLENRGFHDSILPYKMALKHGNICFFRDSKAPRAGKNNFSFSRTAYSGCSSEGSSTWSVFAFSSEDSLRRFYSVWFGLFGKAPKQTRSSGVNSGK